MQISFAQENPFSFLVTIVTSFTGSRGAREREMLWTEKVTHWVFSPFTLIKNPPLLFSCRLFLSKSQQQSDYYRRRHPFLIESLLRRTLIVLGYPAALYGTRFLPSRLITMPFRPIVTAITPEDSSSCSGGGEEEEGGFRRLRYVQNLR